MLSFDLGLDLELLGLVNITANQFASVDCELQRRPQPVKRSGQCWQLASECTTLDFIEQ